MSTYWRVILKSLMTLVLAIMLGCPACFAQGAPDSGSPSSLDLTSADRNISASSLFQSGSASSASINLGGAGQVIDASSLLTPAEYIAVSQVLASGTQSIQLSNLGTAVGGAFALPSNLSSSLSSLVIPEGVSAFHDFGVNSVLNLSGNFNNAGNFFAFSSNSAINSSTLAALNINNMAGANLSSVLSAQALSGLSGMGISTAGLVSSLSLNLNAIQNIVNAGSIASSGNLSMVAGGSISNLGSLAAMQAVNNINLQAANIINSGTIAAQLGNINIVTQQLTNNALMQAMAGDINVINSLSPTAGLSVLQSNDAVMEALNGSINFNVTDNMLKANMDISGGSLLAGNELNFNNGDGTLNVGVKDVSGAINVNTGIASFAVSDGTHGMNIQSFNITGDPNLVYSGTGPFSSGAFNSLGGYVDIDTSSDTSNGSITFTGAINTTPSSTGSGGYVRLNAGTFISTQGITTSANTTGDAGNIYLSAVTDVTIGVLNITGAGGGAEGNIVISAGLGGVSGAVNMASVTGGSSVQGNSVLSISAFDSISGTTITFDGRFLAQTYGDIQFSGISRVSSSLSSNPVSLNSESGNITITSSGINISSTAGNGAGVSLLAGSGIISVTGSINTSAVSYAGPVDLIADAIIMQPGADILAYGTAGNSSGGQVNIFANQNITLRSINTSGSSSGSSDSGAITVFAGTSGTGDISMQNITATSRSTTNLITVMAPGTVSVGNISASSNGSVHSISIIAGTTGTARAPAQSGTLTVGNIDSHGGGSGVGGNILLVNMGTDGNISAGVLNSSAGASGGSFGISIAAGGTVTTGATFTTAGWLGGSVFITSGASSGTAVTVGSIDTRGGGGGSGSAWIVRNPGTTSSIGSIRTGTGGQFDGTPTSPITDITGNTTLTLTPGAASGYNPGGFASINAPASTLILNTANAILPRIPIVARGGDLSIGTLAINNNNTDHAPLILVSSGNLAININIVDSVGLGVVHLHSTAGSISTPSITPTSISRIVLFASQTVNIANGVNYTSTYGGWGGLINILVAGGSINLGSADNRTNNALSTPGTGGIINLIARDDITIYEVDLASLSSNGQVNVGALNGSITLYNEYATSLGANFNSDINAPSISLRATDNISVLRDNTVCCGLTTTQAFFGGSSLNGTLVASSNFGTIDLSDSANLNFGGGSTGQIYLYSAGNIAIATAMSASSVLKIVSVDGGSSISLTGNITASPAFTLVGAGMNTISIGGSSNTLTTDSILIESAQSSISFSSTTITSAASLQLDIDNISVFATATLSGQSVSLTASSIDNNSIITATGSGAVFNIFGQGDISLTGNGTYRISTNNNANAISMSSVLGTLTISGSPIFNAGTGTSAIISLAAQCSTCSIALSSGASPSFQIANGTVNFMAPFVSLSNGSSISTNQVAGNNFNMSNGGGLFTLTLDNGAMSTITTSGGSINLNAMSSAIITQTSGVSTSTLNLNGGAVTLGSAVVATFQIDANVIVQSNQSITVAHGLIINNGTLRTTLNNGSLTFNNASGVAVSGTGTFQASVGASSISLSSAGGVTVSGTPTFNVGASGSVNWTSTASVTVNGGTPNISNANAFTITTPALNLLGTSGITSSVNITATNGGAITVTLDGGDAFTVSAPDFNFTPASNMTFSKNADSGNAVLDVQGGLNVTPSGNSILQINANVVVQANGTSNLQSRNRDITINGTLANTGSGVLQLGSNGSFTLFGIGGTIGSTTSDGSILISSPGTLTLDGWTNYQTSSNGLITWSGTTSVVVNAGSHYIRGETTLSIQSQLVVFNAVSVINSEKTAGTAVSIGSGGSVTIRGPQNSTYSISTLGGAINAGSASTLSFTHAGSGGATTIGQFFGGTANFSSNGVMTVGTNVTLVSNNPFIFTASGTTFANNGTITANGSGANSSITVKADTGNLTINPIGTMNAVQSSGAGGTINFSANSGTLTIRTGTVSVNATSGDNAGGTVNISALNGIISSGGALTINANGFGSGAGGSVNISTLGAAAALTISSTTFTVNARGGTTSGDGGIVSLSAGQNLTVNNTQVNTTPQAGNGRGGQLYLTAGTAAVGVLSFTGAATVSANGLGSGDGGIISLISQTSGGSISLVTTTQFAVNGGNGGGSGGTVTLSASSIPALGGAFTINANAGTGGGSGGTINLTATGIIGDLNTTSVTVSALGSAGGVGGNGGTLNITTGRNLTLNMNIVSLNAQAGNSRGGRINVIAGNSAAGVLTFNSAATVGLNGSGSGQGGTFTISLPTAGSSLTLTSLTTVDANGGVSGGTGGIIAINAPTIPAIAGVVPLVLNANGFTTGNGGDVTIITTGATGDIILGNADNQLQISATGGNSGSTGGNVIINSARAFSLSNSAGINVGVTGANGNGGSLNITASTAVGGDLALNAALSADGVGSGNGGTITVTQLNMANNITLTGSVISAAKGTGLTAGQVNMSIVGSGVGLISINNASSVTADNITLTAASVTNDGLITSNLSAGNITIQSNAGLTLSGTGGIAAATGASNIIIQSSNGAANTLTVNASRTINAGASGTITFRSQDADGIIVFGAATQTISNGATVVVSAPTVTYNDGAAINATGASNITIDSAGAATLTINTPVNAAPASITTTGVGTINISPTTNVTFAKLGATGAINLNSATALTLNVSGTMTVNVGVNVTSNNALTIQANNATVTNNGTINSSPTGGPGTVFIQSTGTLNVTPGTIMVNQSGANSNGGTISIASTGVLTIGASTLNANATGSGTTGGNVLIQGASISPGGLLTINANGANAGSGGVVNVTTTTGSITAGSGSSFAINAIGGASAGQGGTISISAGQDLILNTSAGFSVTPGTNGSGGTINLMAATNGSGNLQVTGSLDVSSNGAGAASGGNINITYRSAAQALSVGSATGNNFISQNIVASGGVVGGAITIVNSDAVGSLSINLTGDIATWGTTNGQIILSKPGSAVSVTGTGQMTGIITSTGTSVNINLSGSLTRLGVQAILSTAGAVNLIATGSSSSVRVISGGTLSSAGGNVTLSSIWMENNGTISSNTNNGAILLTYNGAFTVDGDGSITHTGGGTPSITIETTSMTDSWQFLGAQTFNAGVNGSVNWTAPGVVANTGIALNGAANQTIAGGSTLNVLARGVTITAGSNIVATGASDINITSTASDSNFFFLTLERAGTGAYQISTNGGDINFVGGTNTAISITYSGAGALPVLSLNGGDVAFTPYDGYSFGFSAGVTVQSNSNITINLDGGFSGFNGTLISNQTITTNLGTNSTVVLDGIVRSTTGGNSINFTGTGTVYQLTGTGSIEQTGGGVTTISQIAGGSIQFGDGINLTVTGGNAINFNTPQVFWLGDGTFAASGASTFNFSSPSGAVLNFFGQVGSVGNFTTANGAFNFTPSAGQNLTFTGSGSQHNFNGAALTMTTSGTSTVSVDSSVTVASNRNITVNADGGTFNNSGTLTTSNAGGTIIIRNQSAGLSYGGTGGLVSITGGGSETLTISASGANTLTFSGPQTFNAGSGGLVNFTNNAASASIVTSASANIQIAGDSVLTINTRTLTLGNASVINNTSTNNPNINVTSPSTLSIVGPSGGSATISTGGGPIFWSAANGSTVTFDKSSSGSTTINMNVGATAQTGISAVNNNLTINSGVTVASTGNIIIDFGGANTFTHHGTLTTSKAGGTIDVRGSGITVGGTNGSVLSVTGGGAANIYVRTTGGASALTLNASLNYNVGSAGTVTISGAAVTNSILLNGTTHTVSGGGYLVVSGQQIVMGDGGSFVTDKASGVGIRVNPSGSSANIISADSGSSSFITGGGEVRIDPNAGNTVMFSKSSGGGTTTISILGGSFNTVASNTTTISSDVFIVSDADANIDVNGSTFLNNGGLIVQGTGGNAGTININSTGSLTLSGSGSLSAVTGGGGRGGTINVSAATTLTIPSQSFNVNATGGGNHDAGSIVVSGQSISVTGGALSLNANAVGTGNGGTVTVTSSNGAIVLGSGSGQINISARGGTNGSAAGNGGSAIINAGGAVTISGANAVDVSPRGNNGNGGSIAITASLVTGSNISISSNLNADGVGSGDGGGISIAQASANNNIAITGATISAYKGAGGTTDGSVLISIIGAGSGIISLDNATTVQGDAITFTTTNFTDNGTVTSSSTNGTITIQSNAGLTINGTPNPITVTGNGLGAAVTLSAFGANALTINPNLTLDAGVNGIVTLDASASGGSVVIAATRTVTVTSSPYIGIFAPNVTLNSSSAVQATGSGQYIEVGSGAMNQVLTLPSAGAAAITAANGGQVYVGPYNGSSLTISSSGGSATTLNVNASLFNVYAGTITVNNNVSIVGTADVWVQGDGASSTVTVNGNGQIRTTGANAKLTVGSWAGNLTINGTNTSTAKFAATGSAGQVEFAVPGVMNIATNTLVDVGATGALNIAGGELNIANGVTLTSTGGIALPVELVTLGNGSVLHSNVSTGSAIGNPAGLQAFAIRGTNGGTGTVSTNGGSINFWSYGTMTFDRVSGSTTLNFNGGTVNVASNNGETVIKSGVTVNSNHDINFNVNTGTVESSGQLTTTSSGSISLTAATGMLSIGANAIFYADEGNIIIRNIDTAGGSIDIGAGADIHAYTLSNPTLGNVTIVIGAQNPAQIAGNMPANVTVDAQGGGQVYFGSNGITADGPTNLLNAWARDITFDSGSAPATSIHLGGGVTLTADPPLGNTQIVQNTVSTSSVTTSNLFAVESSVFKADVSRLSGALTPVDTTGPIENQQSPTMPPLSKSASTEQLCNQIGDVNNSVITSTDLNKNSNEEEGKTLEEISFVKPVAQQTYKYFGKYATKPTQVQAVERAGLHTIEMDGCVVHGRAHTKLAIKSGGIELKSGEVVLEASRATAINVNGHKVHMKAGAVVLVSIHKDVTRVSNLCESKAESVQVQVANSTSSIPLSAGQESLIAGNVEQLNDYVAHDNLGHRRTKHISTKTGHNVFKSEVSLISAMQQHELLSDIVASDTDSDNRLESKLVKMAACLMVVTNNHGLYAQGKQADTKF